MGANLHYFVSDVHLGLIIDEKELIERRFVTFLRGLPENTAAIYLLGDIFDFWYEYKYVIPKGYSRILGAFAELSDRGVNVCFIKGNHDLWAFDYFEKEIGMTILKESEIVDIEGVRLCLAHGDKIGGERSYLFMRGLFKNKLLQRLLSSLHPRWVFAFAKRWSRYNRLTRGGEMDFRGESDPLYGYAADLEKREVIDNFIFGHVHTPGSCTTPKGAGFYILGDWINGCEYLVFDSDSREMRWQSGAKTNADNEVCR